MRVLTAAGWVLLVALLGACNSVHTHVTVTTPPAELGLDPFYEKYVDASSVPVVASGAVSDAALLETRELLLAMTGPRLDLLAELQGRNIRVAVIGAHENTTDIPEYRDLPEAYPETDWDKRARGLGATMERPASSVGEENILGCEGDRYRGESIFIHEFAHTLCDQAIIPTDETFLPRLRAAYDAALAAELWTDTYAATNYQEYWAEGVQDWFDSNLEVAPPNGIHNHVNTRAELRAYDPTLAALIEDVFGDLPWRYAYPASPAAACSP